MRHERMKEAEKPAEHQVHYAEDGFLARFVFAENIGLRRFDEPIAVIAPEEIVESLRHFVELVFAVSVLDRDEQLVEARQDFDRVNGKRLGIEPGLRFARTMHLAEAGGVPKLRGEVPAFLDL